MKQNNQNGAQQNVAPGEKAAAMLAATTRKPNATGKGALVVFAIQAQL